MYVPNYLKIFKGPSYENFEAIVFQLFGDY